MIRKNLGKQPSRFLCVLALLFVAATLASASNITYNVNRTIGTGTVTGFIQTDGTVGTLTLANVTDWSLVLFTPVQGSFSLFGPSSGNNSVVWSTGGDISATSTNSCLTSAAATSACSPSSKVSSREITITAMELRQPRPTDSATRVSPSFLSRSSRQGGRMHPAPGTLSSAPPEVARFPNPGR